MRTRAVAGTDRERPPLFGSDGRGRVVHNVAPAPAEELGFKVAGEAAAAAPGARARRELVGDFDGAARPRRARSSVDMRGPSNKAPTQLADRDR